MPWTDTIPLDRGHAPSRFGASNCLIPLMTNMPSKLRSTFLAAILGASAIALGACSAHNRPLLTAVNPATWADRRIDDEPMTFSGSGPLAIDVGSFNGDVMITADSRLTQTTVQVVRESVHGYKRSSEGKESLADISWSAQIVPGEMGQALQVRTSTTNAEPYFQRAHVIIKSPVVDGVKVKTERGRVEAISIQGPVDISTNEADVRVMTNLAMTRPVVIVNRDGDIDYRIRGESTARFDAQTIDGTVTNRIRYGKLTVLSPLTDTEFNAILNDGKNRVSLRTVDGDVRIAVVSNPEQVGELIFD